MTFLGQGQIVPDDAGWFIELIEQTKKNLDLYISAAVKASTEGPFEANETILDYLRIISREVDLAGAVEKLGEAQRGHLLEALRVMGVRLRRMAVNEVRGANADFSALLDSFTRSGTW